MFDIGVSVFYVSFIVIVDRRFVDIVLVGKLVLVLWMS